MPQDQRDGYIAAARKQDNSLQSTARQNIVAGIRNGTLFTAAQLRDQFGKVLPESDLAAAGNMLRNSDATAAPQVLSQFRTHAANYDPAQDVDGAQRSALEQNLLASSLPTSEKNNLMQTINRLGTQGLQGSDRVRSDVYSTIDSIARHPMYAASANRLKTEFNDWHQANPDASRTAAISWLQAASHPQTVTHLASPPHDAPSAPVAIPVTPSHS